MHNISEESQFIELYRNTAFAQIRGGNKDFCEAMLFDMFGERYTNFADFIVRQKADDAAIVLGNILLSAKEDFAERGFVGVENIKADEVIAYLVNKLINADEPGWHVLDRLFDLLNKNNMVSWIENAFVSSVDNCNGNVSCGLSEYLRESKSEKSVAIRRMLARIKYSYFGKNDMFPGWDEKNYLLLAKEFTSVKSFLEARGSWKKILKSEIIRLGSDGSAFEDEVSKGCVSTLLYVMGSATVALDHTVFTENIAPIFDLASRHLEEREDGVQGNVYSKITDLFVRVLAPHETRGKESKDIIVKMFNFIPKKWQEKFLSHSVEIYVNNRYTPDEKAQWQRVILMYANSGAETPAPGQNKFVL